MNWSSIKPSYELALDNAGVTGKARSMVLSFFRSVNTLKNYERRHGWDKTMESVQLSNAECIARQIHKEYLHEFNLLQAEMKLVVTPEWQDIEVLEYLA